MNQGFCGNFKFKIATSNAIISTTDNDSEFTEFGRGLRGFFDNLDKPVGEGLS